MIMKIRKITIKPDNSEIWVVYEDCEDNYIGTLHSKHKEYIKSIMEYRGESK